MGSQLPITDIVLLIESSLKMSMSERPNGILSTTVDGEKLECPIFVRTRCVSVVKETECLYQLPRLTT